MKNLAIIGTSWITQQFIEAADETKSFKLARVYSRTEEKAQTFIDGLSKELDSSSVKISTDLDKFFASDDFDTVYIASPNALHFAQARQAIENGKNVIVEKPSASIIREYTHLGISYIL